MQYLIDSNKVEDIAYGADLMWFESIEVELLMGAYDKPIKEFFDWDINFKLSKSMRMKVLSYGVNKGEYQKERECPLIMYYHFQEYAVYFQEVTPFMFRFLSYLDEHLPSVALIHICEDFGIEEHDEVKELLEETLKSLLLSSPCR